MKYYSTQRPLSPGTFPVPPRSGGAGWNGIKILSVTNYPDRQLVPSIGRMAWGEIEYSAPIPERDAADYDLIPDPDETKLSETAYRDIVIAAIDAYIEVMGCEAWNGKSGAEQHDIIMTLVRDALKAIESIGTERK